ncbi:MAG: transposase zinc-binding domain-containing protein [Myxococcaceae bacterium]
MRESLATFLEESAELGGQPLFVKRDFVHYLDCGVLARGFARVRCRDCGDELLVAFSCKGRGVCPCRDDGRLAYRMKRPAPDGSTHLVLTALELTRRLAALAQGEGHLTRRRLSRRADCRRRSRPCRSSLDARLPKGHESGKCISNL